MVGEGSLNHSPNNESTHNDCMENHCSNDDHAHVQEQIKLNPM